MENLFFESDGIEVIKKDNLIYRIDTTAAFSLNHLFISYLGYEGEFKGIDIKKFTYDSIMKLADLKEDNVLQNWKITMEIFKKDIDSKYLQYYLEPFQLLINIDDKKIEQWCDTICYFYPNVIGEYYKIYLRNIKKCIEKLGDKWFNI